MLTKLSGRKKCGRKRCTTNWENRSLMRIVKQNRFKNLGELHKEWTEAGVKASRATTHRRVEEFVYSCHQRCLTWAKEKKNWTVAQCNAICWCWSIRFLKTNVTVPVYQNILEHFMLPSAYQLFKDADFILHQDLAPAHTAKSTTSWLNDHGDGVLDWPANSPDLNPIENRESMEYCQEENEKQETKQCRWAEGHCQRNLGFHTTSAVPQTDHLHATPNWGSN